MKDTDPLLIAYLAEHASVARDSVVWGKEVEERWPLDIAAYLTRDCPPLACVTSVRALVLKDDALLTMEDEAGLHIMPGGRREPDETPEETLRREVLEESGWTLRIGPLLGVLHFRHRGPQPSRGAAGRLRRRRPAGCRLNCRRPWRPCAPSCRMSPTTAPTRSSRLASG